MEIVPSLILAVIVSLDAFTVGVIYAIRGIRVPVAALLIVSCTSALLMGLAMALGRGAASFLAPDQARQVGATLLVLVGLWAIVRTWRAETQAVPGQIGRPSGPRGPLAVAQQGIWEIRLPAAGLVIRILKEPAAADVDGSGSISPGEALFLGAALALDSVGAGVGAAMAGFSPLRLSLLVGIVGYICLNIGTRMAGLVPWRPSGRLGVLHGLALVALGLWRFW